MNVNTRPSPGIRERNTQPGRFSTSNKEPNTEGLPTDDVYISVPTEDGEVSLRQNPHSQFEMDVFVKDTDGNYIRGFSDNHGSHVAATIGASTLTFEGAPDVKFTDVSPFDYAGRTSTTWILKGIEYAQRMGPDITSNSWGRA